MCSGVFFLCFFFFFKQKTAYEMRISDWSSDVCSSDLLFSKRKRAGRRQVPLSAGSGRRAGRLDAFGLADHDEGQRLRVEQPLRHAPRILRRHRLDQRAAPVAMVRAEEIGRASWREKGFKYV